MTGVRRVGKHLVVDVAGDLALLVHLMSAGRLQLFDKRASLRDRTSRLLVRLADGNELRLREFGTRQRRGSRCCGRRTSQPTTRSRRSGRRRGPTRRRCASCWPPRARARCTRSCATST